MAKAWKIAGTAVVILLGAGIALYAYLPVNRAGMSSELVMLGDVNNDGVWDENDAEILRAISDDPFETDPIIMARTDLNRNGALDPEDLAFLGHLYGVSNPWEAHRQAAAKGLHFPRPRELFSYVPHNEYVQAPLFLLPHSVAGTSPLPFVKELPRQVVSLGYRDALLKEIYSEAIRFSLAWEDRKDSLSDAEKAYAEQKIARCNDLYTQGDYYDLLLDLISLVEDAETLSLDRQGEFVQKVLYFRDHLRTLIVSETFASFTDGTTSHTEIFASMEALLKTDLDMDIDMQSLGSPRDFGDIRNYLDRAQWQVNKSAVKKDAFNRLVQFAQHDRRYLRAVSNTSPRHEDIQLQNHNLPMILLFREALRISGGDKKAALGLVDEVVRIPLGWVKSIPPDMLPSSVALENFLLPGNMEDGPDKTRHWNVFGGVALYKSPRESLELALKREMMDVKDGNYSPQAMREFIRDTIANINGIYYVMAIEEQHKTR